ncbi:hypothetical protein O3Q52_08510 [Streptomyces sp. ActVer]|uniref:hypothetical protein n=1 Tax=unclassified Streptomyces TaxID=2593676 RepID=UPI0022B5A1D8|nr:MULTISPECIES: hypothetical protein [unclassified Streptomyces]MCZ4508243.1 hypothetical protein [Streptomyces sp. ActVer]
MPEPAEQSTPHRSQQQNLELRSTSEPLELLDHTGHVPDDGGSPAGASSSDINSTRTSLALLDTDGPADKPTPAISLGDHDQIGVIALTSNDAPAAAHTLLTDHGFWRPRGVFGSILIHDRYDHDVPARLTRFLADADRQGIGVEYHLPRIFADAGSPAAGKRVEDLWRDNQQREYRRSQREAVRISTSGSDLESLAHGLCHRLPGEWASCITDFADPDSQLDFFDDLWDNASLASAWMQFRVPRAAILTGPNRLELVVIDRPLHRGQVLVGALSLHGITHDYFGDDNAPHAIAVPAEAVRAAHTVSRRLLPRYRQAARRLRKP